MRRRFLAPLVLAFFTLSACSNLDTLGAATTGTISSVAPAAVNKAKQALTAAHDVHASTARLLTIAANTDLCHATCASTAKVYLDKSEEALVAADKLVVLGDAPGINAKIAAAQALIGNVNSLIGSK